MRPTSGRRARRCSPGPPLGWPPVSPTPWWQSCCARPSRDRSRRSSGWHRRRATVRRRRPKAPWRSTRGAEAACRSGLGLGLGSGSGSGVGLEIGLGLGLGLVVRVRARLGSGLGLGLGRLCRVGEEVSREAEALPVAQRAPALGHIGDLRYETVDLGCQAGIRRVEHAGDVKLLGQRPEDGTRLEQLLAIYLETRDLAELESRLECDELLAGLEPTVLERHPKVCQQEADRLPEAGQVEVQELYAARLLGDELLDGGSQQRRRNHDHDGRDEQHGCVRHCVRAARHVVACAHAPRAPARARRVGTKLISRVGWLAASGRHGGRDEHSCGQHARCDCVHAATHTSAMYISGPVGCACRRRSCSTCERPGIRQ
eukprot:scaffold28711_cov65-Phaeocystis_antarctica.AAC.3